MNNNEENLKNEKSKKPFWLFFIIIVVIFLAFYYLRSNKINIKEKAKNLFKDTDIVEKEIVLTPSGEETVKKTADKKGWQEQDKKKDLDESEDDKKDKDEDEEKKSDKQEKSATSELHKLFENSKASFNDLFSSTAWIDEEKTTLYLDWYSKTASFPLKITSKEIKFDSLKDFSLKIAKLNKYYSSFLLVGENKKKSKDELISFNLNNLDKQELNFLKKDLSDLKI